MAFPGCAVDTTPELRAWPSVFTKVGRGSPPPHNAQCTAQAVAQEQRRRRGQLRGSLSVRLLMNQIGSSGEGHTQCVNAVRGGSGLEILALGAL